MIAQENKGQKFGRVSQLDFSVENTDNNEAIVIFEKGDVSYEFIGNKANARTEIHVRIKVFNEDGLDRGNIEIPIYKSATRGESVQSFKANVFNLENGELIKSDSKPQKFEEELTKKQTLVKYTLSNVKVGSVIEYKYDIVSEYFWILDTWYFQKDIPVKKSTISITMPNYISFNYNVLGYYFFKEKDVTQEPTTNGTVFSWTLRDLAPYVEEEYSKPSINYISAIDFELESITYGSEKKITHRLGRGSVLT